MLDFFAIFSKGGIVLWCFQGAGVAESFTGPVNALIRAVILQERSGNNSFTHNALSLKCKLDNEFELVFVVGFQKILTLTYVDKFIDDVQLHFRDRYKNELEQRGALKFLLNNFEFGDDFRRLLREAEGCSKAKASVSMRTFNESQKSQKTVKSMIETKDGDKSKEQGGKKSKNAKKEGEKCERRLKKETNYESQWLFRSYRFVNVTVLSFLLFTSTNSAVSVLKAAGSLVCMVVENFSLIQVDSMKGDLRGVDYESSNDEDEEVQEEDRVIVGGFGGMFGMLKGLVGSKNLTQEDMEPVLDKMRDHLIAKNVAAEIASQLCNSVAKKLEGKVMGTFTTVASTVKQALQDSLVQILQPKRRVDILRDVLEARSQRKPFVITFCGVNGVGKSTNLAKISYWLIENGFTVLIAACDTFRAGAVEQLRTHQRRLNSLHPPEKHGGQPAVQLFEKGYGKDAAGIAMEAIAFARNQGFDVVLIDTAGRMQDNAPLMTALAKLITVNTPDLVLFVGEALVGNEAVDQLVKFNQALADHSKTDKPRLIDGIVLTKFDTIDDKVGAAISMTYITGQPIVFVGTGQTYSDLRSLNARAVVSALMKA
uniref:Signal recognition particle receptor subunit alpha-like n=1 Tax=Sinocyclocheilus anshuiensis TaxID=1608454 RepID=A0A671L7G1_9TELE